MTMKKQNFKLILLLLAAIPVIFFTACEEDDPMDPGDSTDEFQPVLNENFSYEVDGNDVNFTTTLSGNVWVTVNEVDHQMEDQAVTVNLPNMGTYSFTCSSLGSGEVLASTPFDVVIEQDDLAFLNQGLWLYLSGGANQTKTWKLDMSAEYETSIHFAGPMYFSGYSDGDDRRDEYVYWAWDVLPEELPYTINGAEQTSFYNWEPDYPGNTWIMAPNDYGTITFDGTNGTASTTIFGETVNGTFTFDSASWKMGFSAEIILPIDTARVNEGQYLEQDLANVRIFSLTDSAMQIGIKRSFEGGEESKWVNVYNFIVDGYEYPYDPVVEVDVTWPDAPTAVTTDVTAESAKFDGSWIAKDAPDFNAWYPGFWNFTTSMNDVGDEYMGTNQEGNVYWDPFIPAEGDTWAAPSDSIKALVMTFDAANLTFSIASGAEVVSSGSFATDGVSITTDGGMLINPSGNVAYAPNTAVISVLPDAAVAGDEMKYAFYQADGSNAKNEWIELTFVKQ